MTETCFVDKCNFLSIFVFSSLTSAATSVATHRDLYCKKNASYCAFDKLYKNKTMLVKKCHLLTLQQTAIYFLKLNNTNTVPQRQLPSPSGKPATSPKGRGFLLQKKCHSLYLQQMAICYLKLNNTNAVPSGTVPLATSTANGNTFSKI